MKLELRPSHFASFLMFLGSALMFVRTMQNHRPVTMLAAWALFAAGSVFLLASARVTSPSKTDAG